MSLADNRDPRVVTDAGRAWRFPPKTVIVAVDFGEASARATALAGALAAIFGARLNAVHAERFEPPPYFTMEQIAKLEAERRLAEAAAARHLAEFVARATAQPANVQVADEPPVEAVLHAAAAADLIVVGTHGRRGPGRWWMGSVAERIVRGATVPVLVTRAAQTAAVSFSRIVLIGDGVAPASDGRVVAQGLADAFGGEVVAGGSLGECRPEVVRNASLAVIELAAGHSGWPLSDGVAKVLGACEIPVLFVPAPATRNGD